MNERVHSQAKAAESSSFTIPRSGLLQRKCACGGTPGVDGLCAECRSKRLILQRSRFVPTEQSEAPPIVHEVLRAPGRPLDAETRSFMEPRFGHDFSRIAVYSNAPVTVQPKLTTSALGDGSEQEAARVAEKVMRRPDHEDARPTEVTPEQLQIGRVQASDAQGTPVPPIVHEVLRSPGQQLDARLRTFMESGFGWNFNQVQIHTDGKAAESARALNARAFTAGRDIVFGAGEYLPSTRQGRQLIAHELTHVVQQEGAGKLVQRYEAGEHAQLGGTQAGLKTAFAPGSYTVRKGDTLEAIAGMFGITIDELKDANKSKLKRWPARDGSGRMIEGFDAGETVVIPQALNAVTVAEAFLILKRAENTKAQDASYSPTGKEANSIDLAIAKLKSTDKYVVDPNTYHVSFKPKEVQKTKLTTIEEYVLWVEAAKGTEVTTIEDFILFVETVERFYPAATPSEIASEIRQLWFSDVNWEVLVASQGITEKTKSGETKFVDIESPPNKIAMMFAMQNLAPKSGGKIISTPMGDVDIGHVMAGIDAALSGAPSQYPKTFLKALGHHSSEAELKHKTLREGSGGDVRDFTTWAGDLGQAYAEYLVERWVKGSITADLDKFVKEKTSDAQLLGDIHGYIALIVGQEVPAESSPSGTGRSVSNILRDLYLVSKKASGTEQSYQKYFEGVSGKKSEELRALITERTRSFARPWYAKKALEHKGYWSSKGWGKEAVLDNLMKDFDEKHKKNEAEGGEENKLDGIVKKFMDMLKRPIP